MMSRCFFSKVRVGLNLMAVSPQTPEKRGQLLMTSSSGSPRWTPSVLIPATILSLLAAVSQSTAQNVPRPRTLLNTPGYLEDRSSRPRSMSSPTSVTRPSRFSLAIVSRTASSKINLDFSPTHVLNILRDNPLYSQAAQKYKNDLAGCLGAKSFLWYIPAASIFLE